jgi:hypothetical protein
MEADFPYRMDTPVISGRRNGPVLELVSPKVISPLLVYPVVVGLKDTALAIGYR